MAFRTKIDFSSNRQIKQHQKTFTELSGGTSFGLTFSAITTGPDLSTSIVTEFQLSVSSSFSGNSASTIYNWYDPRMELGTSALSALTPANSGITQETGEVYTAVSYTTVDGNTSATLYTGVSFDITNVVMTDLGGGNYSGTVLSDIVDFLQAEPLDFTGRTIWVDSLGITRTERLIITNNAQVGNILTCVDSEGMAGWEPFSGSAVFSNFVQKSGDTMSGTLTSPAFITISGTSVQFVKGDGTLDSTVYEDSANKQNNMNVDGFGIKYPTVDAVNFQANTLAKSVISTGFIDTSDGFSLYMFDDFTLGISGSTFGIAFKDLFDTPPFAPSSAIVQLTSRTVPLSSISLPLNNIKTMYVGYRQSDDTVIYSDTSFFLVDTVCQLGFMTIKNSGGTISFLDPLINVTNLPDIAAYNNLLTTVDSVRCSMPIAANSNSGLKLNNADGYIIGISVGWGTSNNDLKTVSGNTPMSFTRQSPLDSQTLAPATFYTDVDPTVYYNGVGLVSPGNNSSATVQRILLVFNGTFIVQYGEIAYANLAIAQNNMFNQTFTEIIPIGTYVEVGRLAIQKNCVDIASALAQYVPSGVNSGGGAGSLPTGTTITIPTALINTFTDNLTDKLQVNGSAIATAWKTVGGTANEYVKGDGSLGFITGGTTYVDVLNINTVGVGPGITDLGVDANGFVVNQASDIRLKKNINTIENALNKVLKLRGVTYNWKDASRGGEDLKIGLIAQEVLEAVPELVTFNGDYLGVQYKEITALLIEAIKEITISKYTPSSSFDDRGIIGNISVDDDYLYIKTNKGWKRTNLESF